MSLRSLSVSQDPLSALNDYNYHASILPVCTGLARRITTFLSHEPETLILKSVQQQTRTALAVIDSALERYRYSISLTLAPPHPHPPTPSLTPIALFCRVAPKNYPSRTKASKNASCYLTSSYALSRGWRRRCRAPCRPSTSLPQTRWPMSTPSLTSPSFRIS